MILLTRYLNLACVCQFRHVGNVFVNNSRQFSARSLLLGLVPDELQGRETIQTQARRDIDTPRAWIIASSQFVEVTRAGKSSRVFATPLARQISRTKSQIIFQTRHAAGTGRDELKFPKNSRHDLETGIFVTHLKTPRIIQWLALLLAITSNPGGLLAATGTGTQIQYLSGTGKDDGVLWDFYCTAGMQSGEWKKIAVPSCWELQGFGVYNYGYVFRARSNEDVTLRPGFASEQGKYKNRNFLRRRTGRARSCGSCSKA